jgi:tetratricopeptide (TPR) repeat protein
MPPPVHILREQVPSAAEKAKPRITVRQPYSMAAEQKELGNAEFKAGNYEKAITFFTKSIELGGDHVLYSNRSACYGGLGKWGEALKDAESCIEKAPTWPKVRLTPRPSPHAAARACFA